MKIDPCDITKYDRTDDELQRFWAFCVIVAGKNADWASQKVSDLFREADARGASPFGYIRENSTVLHNMLTANRVGQYRRIERALLESSDIDLRNARLEDLENVFGVGPKTARFFLLHTRPGVQVAVLDTHILRWMQSVLPDQPMPRSTPALPAYRKYEALCLHLMRSHFGGMTYAQADLLIWCQMSGRLADDIAVKYSQLPATSAL